MGPQRTGRLGERRDPRRAEKAPPHAARRYGGRRDPSRAEEALEHAAHAALRRAPRGHIEGQEASGCTRMVQLGHGTLVRSTEASRGVW